MTDRPRTPSGLGRRGKALWRSVVDAYDLRADELATLEEAARTLDTCARLDAELAVLPLVVNGSTGQARPNPLLGELRGHRQVLAQLLRLLALGDVPEDVEDGATMTPKQARAKHAAEVRWALRPTGGGRRG